MRQAAIELVSSACTSVASAAPSVSHHRGARGAARPKESIELAARYGAVRNDGPDQRHHATLSLRLRGQARQPGKGGAEGGEHGAAAGPRGSALSTAGRR